MIHSIAKLLDRDGNPLVEDGIGLVSLFVLLLVVLHLPAMI